MILLQALKLCNTVFTCEVLVQEHGAVVYNVIASCRDSLVAYLLGESNNLDPSCGDISAHNQSNKHSPFCTQCDQGGSQKESLSHQLVVCRLSTLGEEWRNKLLLNESVLALL